MLLCILKCYIFDNRQLNLLFLYRKLHTPTNILLLALAVSDLLVGLQMPFEFLFVESCWFLGDFACFFFCFFLFLTVTSASVGNMVLISVDRYVAICDPLHYSTRVTQRRVQISVCLCWACSVFYNILILTDIHKQPDSYNSCIGECVFVIGYTAGNIDLVLTFVGPITVIIVLYMRVFVVAVSQARAMRSHIVSVSVVKVRDTAGKSERKAARTLGIVIVVFLLCFCPFYCLLLIGQDTSTGTSAGTMGIWLLYLNSCLNPVIYALFYPWFRKAVKLIVTLEILQPDSHDANVL